MSFGQIPPFEPALYDTIITPESLDFWKVALATNDEAEIRERILKSSEEAYSITSFPCIKLMRFLHMPMTQNFAYPKVLEEGRSGETQYLDIGCFWGVDLRKLILDGYPAKNTHGVDIYDWSIVSSKLFTKSTPTKFLVEDIFAPEYLEGNSELSQLKGSINHIFLGSVFHLFEEEQQIDLARRISRLWKRDNGKGVIFGLQRGMVDGEEGFEKNHLGVHLNKMYAHSPRSWAKLWKETIFPGDDGIKVEAIYRPEDKFLIWAVYNTK